MNHDETNRYLREQLQQDQSAQTEALLSTSNMLEQGYGHFAHEIKRLNQRIASIESENRHLHATLTDLRHTTAKLGIIIRIIDVLMRIKRHLTSKWHRILRQPLPTVPDLTADTCPEDADRLSAEPACDDTSSGYPGDLERRNARDEKNMRMLYDDLPVNGQGDGLNLPLLIDVTHTVSTDSTSGIQRMVRHLAREAIRRGGRPVRILGQELATPNAGQGLQTVDLHQPTLLLLPDVSWLYTEDVVHHLQTNRAAGGTSVVILTDLLSVTLPLAFPFHARTLFKHWMQRCVLKADAVICISRTTADELREYCVLEQLPPHQAPHIGWVHCGVEPLSSQDTRHQSQRLAQLSHDGIPFLLSVSTLEIRKGYPVMLDAMDRLWTSGKNFRYVIVGRYGWSQRALRQRIVSHPEFGRRLIWLEDVEDAELAWLYANAHVLVSGSVAEGFGLPIVEAAHYGTRALVSDIPVYREIFGDHVSYFESLNPSALEEALRDLLAGSKPGTGLPGRPWTQAMTEILTMIAEGSYQYPASRNTSLKGAGS